MRIATALIAMTLVAPGVHAQDHSAHAGHAQMMARSIGGTFELRSVDGVALPAPFPSRPGARMVGGSLELALVRPDTGRFVVRFRTVAAPGDTAITAVLEGAVRVVSDSLLFWPVGAESRPPVRFRYVWTPARAIDLIDEEAHRWAYGAATADTAFTRVQSRGRAVMGVDQYTSTHVFESLPDGGRIVLQRDAADPVGESTIRAHLRDIATRFERGDFTLPGQVHGMDEVPGTKVMAERRRRIRYRMKPLPRGGEVRIITTDAAALAAVHEFLAFQRMDHRAGGHDH